MTDFVLKEIVSDNWGEELQQIGFDEEYIHAATDKLKYKNIKIYNLSSAQANIIKQTALTVGSDCATNKNVITGKAELTNAILTGSLSQLKKIAEKLQHQPFGLKNLSSEILNFIQPKNRVTKLAGILNITPDSFSDGGKYFDCKDAEKHLIQLIEDGADLVDIGAESTRPYSEPVEPFEQIKRLKPILEFIQHENIKTPISIDTRSSEVADFSLNYGVSIINDVSGFEFDKKLPEIIAKYNAGVVIQHTKGIPQNMQISPHYNNVTEEIFINLKEKIEYAKSIGIKEIIADVGIGFGKTKKDNFTILNKIEEFYGLRCPIMVGVSRKSLLGIENTDNNLKDTLTAAISYPLIQKGVDYLRVHNVKLHKYLLNLI